jgi:hypothetical protein
MSENVFGCLLQAAGMAQGVNAMLSAEAHVHQLKNPQAPSVKYLMGNSAYKPVEDALG